MKNPVYRTARIKYTYIPMWAQRFVFDRVSGVYSIGENDNSDGVHVCFQEHRHNELEVLHIVKGSMTVEDSKGCRTASEGDIYIFSHNEPHFGYITQDTQYVEYCFFTADLARFAPPVGGVLSSALFGKGGDVRFESPVRDAELGRMIDALADFNDSLGGDGGAELAMTGILYSIMARLNTLGCIGFGSSESGTGMPTFQERMNDFISRSYACDITTEMLRRQFPYAPSYFCRLFKQHYGCAFFKYLEKYRVDRAQTLLLSGRKLSVGEIAEEVGFGGGPQLSRSFKRVTGISPGEFVKRNGKVKPK